MEPSDFEKAASAAADAAKPNDRSERDRWTQIVITKLQEVKALAAYYDVADAPAGGAS